MHDAVPVGPASMCGGGWYAASRFSQLRPQTLWIPDPVENGCFVPLSFGFCVSKTLNDILRCLSDWGFYLVTIASFRKPVIGLGCSSAVEYVQHVLSLHRPWVHSPVPKKKEWKKPKQCINSCVRWLIFMKMFYKCTQRKIHSSQYLRVVASETNRELMGRISWVTGSYSPFLALSTLHFRCSYGAYYPWPLSGTLMTAV
jgi:hypothetical protein